MSAKATSIFIAVVVALAMLWTTQTVAQQQAPTRPYGTESSAQPEKQKEAQPEKQGQDVPKTVENGAEGKKPAKSEGKRAAQSEKVRHAQQALKDKGHDPGPIDGVMGPKTKAAIEEFQEKEGLTKTGRLDQQTMSKLGVSAASASSDRPSVTGKVKEKMASAKEKLAGAKEKLAGTRAANEIEGTIKSVDGNRLVFDDGSEFTLSASATADRAALRPGMKVKANYEEKNGQKLITSIQAEQEKQ